jgi:hypothetical protein
MKVISAARLEQLIQARAAEYPSDTDRRQLESLVKRTLTDAGYKIALASYDDVANMVAGGAEFQDILVAFGAGTEDDLPDAILSEWYDKAAASPYDFVGPNNDDPSPAADESPFNMKVGSMPVTAQQQIEDALAARIIEVLASSGDSSVNYVATKVGEPEPRVAAVVASCHQTGILERTQSGLFRCAQATIDRLQEHMVEDGFTLRASAQLIKESAPAPNSDNGGTGVDEASSVQDAIAPGPHHGDPASGGGVADPTDGTTTGVTEHKSVHDAVPNDTTSNPAPGGTGTNSDIGSDAVDSANSVQDAVPGTSQDGGRPPGSTASLKPIKVSFAGKELQAFVTPEVFESIKASQASA